MNNETIHLTNAEEFDWQELKALIQDLGYVRDIPRHYVVHFKTWNKTWDPSSVVSCDKKLTSAMKYNTRRHVDLYVHYCSKKLMEEKDKIELKVVDAEPNDTIKPSPINVEPNVDADVDSEEGDEGEESSDVTPRFLKYVKTESR